MLSHQESSDKKTNPDPPTVPWGAWGYGTWSEAGPRLHFGGGTQKGLGLAATKQNVRIVLFFYVAAQRTASIALQHYKPLQNTSHGQKSLCRAVVPTAIKQWR